MTKILVGYLLIVFDLIVSPDKKAKFDLLPDFVGYVIIIYAFYKIWKQHHDSKEIRDKLKINGIVSIVAFVVSYISYLLDMYGLLHKQSQLVKIGLGILNDGMLVAVLYLFVQVLKSIQGDEKKFQIKRMTMLWRFIVLCLICEYISLPIVAAASAFMIFEKLIELIFAAYIYTSAQTYKMIIQEKSKSGQNENSKNGKGKSTTNSNKKTNQKKTMNIKAIANSQKFSKDK